MAAVSHRKGFPSDASGKEVAWRCKRHRFNPWIRKIPWKKEMRTQSSILACKTSWTEEIHRLQSMVPTNQRPLSDWVLASLASRISRVHPAEDSLPSPLTVRLPSLRSSLAASWNFSSLTGGSSNWQHGSRLPLELVIKGSKEDTAMSSIPKPWNLHTDILANSLFVE